MTTQDVTVGPDCRSGGAVRHGRPLQENTVAKGRLCRTGKQKQRKLQSLQELSLCLVQVQYLET